MTPFNYISVCSGVEAVTVACHDLGMTPIIFSEIEAFPARVLAYRHAGVPNLGDMTRFADWPIRCDCGAAGPGSEVLVTDGKPIAFNWQSGQGVSAGEEKAPCLIKNQTNAVATFGRPVDMGGEKGQAGVSVEKTPTLNTTAGGHAVLEGVDAYNGRSTGQTAATIGAQSGGSANHAGPSVLEGAQVRRVTPVECERLQGFPDNYTLIPGDHVDRKPEDLAETVAYLIGHGLPEAEARALADSPDGPRYKAMGNSMAVPVMRRLGRRIKMVHDAVPWSPPQVVAE